MTKKNILIVIIGVVALSSLIGVGGWFLFHGEDIPETLENLALEEIDDASFVNAPLEPSALPEIGFVGDFGFSFSYGSSAAGIRPLSVTEPTVSAPTASTPRFDFDFSGMNFAPAQQPSGASEQPGEPDDIPDDSEEPPAGDTPPAGYEPSDAECAQFLSAPSCDYVPAAAQDICLQCKQ